MFVHCTLFGKVLCIIYLPLWKVETMSKDRKLSVFLCHSSNDKPIVRELYQRLNTEGWVDPWLDEEKLLPGQDWDLEIEKAVEAADAVVICLSNNSVTKEGYIQREMRFVLRIADFKPEGTVFVIPVRLDDCPMPRRLSMWQYVDYFPESRKNWAYQRILTSLSVRAEKLRISVTTTTRKKIEQKPVEKGAEILPEQEKAALESVVAIPQQRDYPPARDMGLDMLREILHEDSLKIYTFADMPFMRVPEGKFLMGSKDDNGLAWDNERPQQTVELPEFYIARYPVTNEQYLKFTDAARYVTLAENEGGENPEKGGFAKGYNWRTPLGRNNIGQRPKHPVVQITWQDAIAYMRWLNEKSEDELPSGYRFVLPTEAQWEKAARGEYGNEWPWGNEFDKNRCSSRESEKGDTVPVDAYSAGASPYGVMDMVGNVWEWTHTLYKEYPYKDDGRESEEEVGRRVLRGGSFNRDLRFTRCASRGNNVSDTRGYALGFRICVSPA
jgi:formylglycine-generating enzyme required for sulfatase activity